MIVFNNSFIFLKSPGKRNTKVSWGDVSESLIQMTFEIETVDPRTYRIDK